MIVDWTDAPTAAEVRPALAGEPVGPGFPVYPDIAATLAAADPDSGRPVPSSPAAHVLATCAAYSYGDAATVATIMARMGLTGNRCLRVAQEVDALLITSTAFVVQSEDGRDVLVSCRGTRPTGLVDVIGDSDAAPERLRVPLPCSADEHEVHAGFYRNVRATRFVVLAALKSALEGRPVTPPPGPDGEPPAATLAPMERLYVTGHSLGGAMTALMGILLAPETDPVRRQIAQRMRAVHTFGQPMVGTPEFAATAGKVPWPADGTPLAQHLHRRIHRRDVVATFRSSAFGSFAHVGAEWRYGPGRGWVPARIPTWQATTLVELALSPLSLLADTFALTRELWPGPAIADRLPEHYVTRLAPPWVTTEYGD